MYTYKPDKFDKGHHIILFEFNSIITKVYHSTRLYSLEQNPKHKAFNIGYIFIQTDQPKTRSSTQNRIFTKPKSNLHVFRLQHQIETLPVK